MESRQFSLADDFHETMILELVFDLHKTLSYVAGELRKLQFGLNKRDDPILAGRKSINFDLCLSFPGIRVIAGFSIINYTQLIPKAHYHPGTEQIPAQITPVC